MDQAISCPPSQKPTLQKQKTAGVTDGQTVGPFERKMNSLELIDEMKH
jgi:hypothetical protein